MRNGLAASFEDTPATTPTIGDACAATQTSGLNRISALIAIMVNMIIVRRYANGINLRHSVDIRFPIRRYSALIFLCTLGHLEDWAGVDLIYELAKCLNEKVTDSTILLVGSGESTSKLLSRLIHSNLGHMVTHAGLQPYSMMPLFTAVSDVTLCIFPDTPVSHAASPLKLFEYLSSGTTVIATNVAGTTEVVDNTSAMLVPPGNTTEICKAVVTLRNDENLRKTLGEKGRKLVEEEYSWSKLAQRLIDICEKFAPN